MKKSIGKMLIGVLLFVGLMSALIPFIWMISTSLKDGAAVYRLPPEFLVRDPQWENYAYVFDKVPMLTYLANSVFVTLMVTLGTLITTVLAAFAFARLQFPGKDLIFTILIASMMVPGEVLIAPNFVTISKLGILNTRTALFLPWIASAFSIFFLREHFLGIPEDYYKAAKVDGASDLQYLWHIMLPNARSALVTIAILRVINSWNEFLWPLLMTNTPEMRTLPVGLSTFMTEAGGHYQYLMAYSSLVIIPVIIVFFIFRKKIMENIGKGGLKG